MKKLIAFSSVLALVVASSGLFAFDILNGEGEATGFSVSSGANFGFDILTPEVDAATGDDKPTTIYQVEMDPQANVEIGVSYDKDNYAFGLAARIRKNWLDGTANPQVDNAWGKYYFMDKQLWLRAGSLERIAGLDTDPLNNSWAEGLGVQFKFSPSAVNGLSLGLSLPVPFGDTRPVITSIEGGTSTWGDSSWGPAYPFANMRFGLRLNGTVPNLDFGTELKLNGLVSTNGKLGKDEAEGDFTGMDFHFTAVYSLLPLTIKAALLAQDIADGREKPLDTVLTAGVRLSFAMPTVAPNLSLGEPWVMLIMHPSDRDNTEGKRESFKDMAISFEWEPSYYIVPEKVQALLWFQVLYNSWVKPTPAEEDYPIGFSVQPKVVFTFAPNATISIYDTITPAQQKIEKGFKNTIGFRFAWGF